MLVQNNFPLDNKISAPLFDLAFSFQFERDVSMWNHKSYKSNPVLVKDDGPIRKYRNWYMQFYSTITETTEVYRDAPETQRDNKKDDIVLSNGAPIKESLNVRNLDW